MGEILDIDGYIGGLMRVGITSEELFSKLTRSLYQLEDLFLSKHKINTRNTVRTCIALSRMMFDHEQLMTSARKYLISRIGILTLRERDLNHEISILRAGSSPEVQGYGADRDRSQDLSIIPTEREAILREIDKSELNLSKLSEEIQYKKAILHDIEARIEDASHNSLPREHLGCKRSSSPSSCAHDPASTAGSDRVGRTPSRLEFCPRGGVPQYKTHIHSYMDMSHINELTSGEFGTSDRHGDAVPGVARSSSGEGNSCMGAACVHEDDATAAVIETASDQQQLEASPNRRQEETASHSGKGKRKATTSPDSNEDNAGIINTPSRPNKTRVIAAYVPPNTALIETGEQVPDMISSDNEIEVGYEQLAEGRFHSSSPEKENRITRSQKKKEEKSKIKEGFDKLLTVRMDKMITKIDNLNKSINQSKKDKTRKSTNTNSGTEEEVEDSVPSISEAISISSETRHPQKAKNPQRKERIKQIKATTNRLKKTLI